MVASRLGVEVVGLLGLLAEAKRNGFIDAVKPVLDDMIDRASFWVSSHLYDTILREVGE